MFNGQKSIKRYSRRKSCNYHRWLKSTGKQRTAKIYNLNEAISILWRVYFDRFLVPEIVSRILYRSIYLSCSFFSRIREEDFTERRAFAQESKNPRSLDPRYIRGGKRNSGLLGRGSFNVHRLDSSISSIVVATGRARGIPRNFVKVISFVVRKSEI